ncbi:uncharacterized protein LOC133218187 isoform X2 [Neopsephotus bourkii]|nr:uncharacterized protein LOC133218187 isoform X2 [Neopsephotus bourkii]XP_061220346.1 uncharacterized protein LOC133218187 isoform X2 [Neopsephotus bourkii]
MGDPDVFLDPCEGALCGLPGQKRRCMSALEPVTGPGRGSEEEEEEEEEEDRVQAVPLRRSCALRIGSRDPFRRHSWEPGKELRGGPGYNHLRVSPKGLSPDDIDSSMEQLDGLGCHQRDPRRNPFVHSNDDLESLLSQTEANERWAQEDAQGLPISRSQQSFHSYSLSKSASLGIINRSPDADEISLFASQQNLVNG